MWDEKRFHDNVARLVEALTPLASPGNGFGSAAVKEASLRGRHFVEQLRVHVLPSLPDSVAQNAVGTLGRLEAMLEQLGNPAAVKHDQTRTALAARNYLAETIAPAIGKALKDFPGGGSRRAVLFAQDIRVSELQFLSALEQAGDFHLTPGVDVFRDAPADVLCQMVYALLEDGALNGQAALPADTDPSHTEARRVSDLRAVQRREPIDLCLNHRGRLRLARLRDELLAFDKKERFGILLDARGLDRVLAAELAITTADRRLAVIAGDVDRFKAINDRYGHPRGDDVLKAVFRIFSEAIDTHGNAFRQGGEEVIGILPVETDQEASAIAESVRARVEVEVAAACKLPDRVTISLGLLTLVDGARTPSQVTQEVDKLLYAAKEKGRNCVVTSLASRSMPADPPPPER